MDTIAEVKNQITFKWLWIPYSILVIVVAASGYNLAGEWKEIAIKQGYDVSSKEYIQYTVLLGYFGLFPGIFIHHFGNIWTFSTAAVCALIGYGGLGYFASFTIGSGYHLAGTLIWLLIASFSSSIATVAAIWTPVENLTKRASLLTIVLWVIYLHFANCFEFSFRASIFQNIRASVYFPILGVFLGLIYLMSLQHCRLSVTTITYQY